MTSGIEIVAELGQGFEGRQELASLLLRAAADAGADAAKFQLVFADELATDGYAHYDLFKRLEMSDDAWAALAAEAASRQIALQVDVFGARSLALAQSIDVGAVKVHPTDLANVGLLEAIAASGVPRVILGVGGSYAAEIDRACRILADKPLVVLLGFQAYPTPDATNQVSRVRYLAERLQQRHRDLQIGFADHASPELPTRVALAAAAVGAGAVFIEKHLTLGRNMKLEDYESALNPDEFAEFVTTLRACAEAMGQTSAADDFGMSAEEARYRATIRRQVVAARALAAGALLAPADVVLKRTPGTRTLDDPSAVVGRRLTRAVAGGDAISAEDVV